MGSREHSFKFVFADIMDHSEWSSDHSEWSSTVLSIRYNGALKDRAHFKPFALSIMGRDVTDIEATTLVSRALQTKFGSTAYDPSKCSHSTRCTACRGWNCPQFAKGGDMYREDESISLSERGPAHDLCWKGAYAEICKRAQKQNGVLLQAVEEDGLGEGQEVESEIAEK